MLIYLYPLLGFELLTMSLMSQSLDQEFRSSIMLGTDTLMCTVKMQNSEVLYFFTYKVYFLPIYVTDYYKNRTH